MVIDMIIQALSSQFSILILYLLNKYEEMKLTEILGKIGFSKYKSVRKTIMLLAKAGLVSIAIKKITPRVKAWKIKITNKGKQIIEALVKNISPQDEQKTNTPK